MPNQRMFPIVRTDIQVNTVMTFVGMLSYTSLVILPLGSSSNTIESTVNTRLIHHHGHSVTSLTNLLLSTNGRKHPL